MRRWIDKAREVAKEYRSNCAELRRMQDAMGEIKTSLEGTPVKGGKISKPVEAAVEQEMMQERLRYLEQAVGAVEYALECVAAKPQGDITKRLFNMVYSDRSHTLYGAATVLHIAEPTAKRYNRYLLKMIAKAMGFLKVDTF